MSTFKLMSRLWSRNKFYKNLILAVIALYSGFLLYATIASIRQEAPADTLSYAFSTLFPQYLMVIFFLFFSYECFVKINRYKETFSTCKQGIGGAYRAQLLLLFSLIGVLTMVACLLIVGYACVAHQVALLPHVLSRVICYQVLCPAAAVYCVSADGDFWLIGDRVAPNHHHACDGDDREELCQADANFLLDPQFYAV